MKGISVLIIDGETNVALPVARCLSQVPNLKLNVISDNPWVHIRFSRCKLSHRVQMPGNNDEKRLDAIRQTITQTNDDIILPVSEPAIRFVSKHYEVLKGIAAIPLTPKLDVFDIAVNKWLLADFMVKQGIPCPHTVLYTADEEFVQNLHKLSFPVLLKPTQGSDGRNIQYFDNQSSLLDFLKGNQSFFHKYIVQSFINGHDIDCSVLCQDGKILAYTIQKGFIPGSQRFASPVGIEFLRDEQTLDVVTRLISTLNWSGIAHIDLRYDELDKQVKVLEINARYWATLLGSLVVGVNFPSLACMAALGVSFPVPAYHLKRFIGNGAAIKHGARRYIHNGKVDFSFQETNWRYVLTDPFPELFNLVRKCSWFLSKQHRITM